MKRLIYGMWFCLVACGLLAVPADPATFYVAKTGSDSNPGTEALPRLTINSGADLLNAGDTLYIGAGIYNERLSVAPPIYRVPSGTGVNNRTLVSAKPITRTCTGNNPIPYQDCYASTYEAAILKPTGGGANGNGVIEVLGPPNPPFAETPPEWITFEGLTVDDSISSVAHNGLKVQHTGTPCLFCSGGTGTCTDVAAGVCTTPGAACPESTGGTCTGTCTRGSASVNTTPKQIRFLNMTVIGAKDQGATWTTFVADLPPPGFELLNVRLLDNGRVGSTLNHGAYGAGGVIDGGEASRTKGGYGYQIYKATGNCTGHENQVPANTILRNLKAVGNFQCGFIIGGVTRDTTLSNSLIYGNGGCGILVNSARGGSHKIYNNTSVDNGSYGLQILEFGDDAIIRNTIYEGSSIHSGATGLVLSNNYNKCPTCDSPDFVDPANGDYRLQAGDARIDAGADLTSVGITIDHVRAPRPQGAAYDIGAYEFLTGAQPFDFSLTATNLPPMQQNSSVTSTIQVKLTSGTPAAVSLTASGLPAGASISFLPPSCTPPCSSVATVQAPIATAAGTYPLTTIGTSGATVRTAPLSLAVFCLLPGVCQ